MGKLPTITDLRDRLTDLIDSGFGECAVEVLLVPDTTIQTIAEGRRLPDQKDPPLAIELAGVADRFPVVICSSQPTAKPEDPER